MLVMRGKSKIEDTSEKTSTTNEAKVRSDLRPKESRLSDSKNDVYLSKFHVSWSLF